MFVVTVTLKSTPQVIQFHFDDYNSAAGALDRFKRPNGGAVPGQLIHIDDTYGCKSAIMLDQIAGMFLTDVEKEMDALAACKFLEAKMVKKAQAKMQNDPASRMVLPGGNGAN